MLNKDSNSKVKNQPSAYSIYYTEYWKNIDLANVRPRFPVISEGAKPPACLTAILGNNSKHNHFQSHFDGEQLNIYPGYTEFRPHEKDMNLCQKEFKEFTPYNEKTVDQLTKQHNLHADHLKSRPAERPITRKSYYNMINTESRIYAQPQNILSVTKTPRGLITCISRKSANRLKKLMCRTNGMDVWIDLTFSDDVFEGLTFQERLKKAYDCLNKFERVIKKFKIHYIWKKEIKPRLSGVLKGKRVCHYHVALVGLSPKQLKHYKRLCISLLTIWVAITGTKNHKALLVALHKDKKGIASSYRLMENTKQETIYISKYFSKTEPIEGYEPESIGRAWGYDRDLPQYDPFVVNLTRQESAKIRRLVAKGLRFKKGKGFIGIKEQLQKGFSTFTFIKEDTIFRLINAFVPDPFKEYDPIPF